jgi:hypothetical protein
MRINLLLFTSILFMAVLAGAVTRENQERKPTAQVGLLETGSFHGEEVSALTGEKWLGLYISDNHSILLNSRLRVETVHDDIGDSPEEKTGKEVSVELPLQPIFLVRRATMLREGPVNTVFAEKPDYEKTLEKVSPLSLKLAQTSYALKVVGADDGAQCSEHAFPKGAQLVLASGDSTQVLYSLEDCGNEPYWYLLWAGDLDSDGKLDLYVRVSYHYNVAQRKLFLSSQAAEGQLVKEVAEFVTSGC